MNQYLVPANTKKSKLILGFFTTTDLFVVGAGGIFTVVLLLFLKNPPLWQLILAITPLLISVFLVFPVPNYHNVMQLITNILNFYTGRRNYYWKGWCVKLDDDK